MSSRSEVAVVDTPAREEAKDLLATLMADAGEPGEPIKWGRLLIESSQFEASVWDIRLRSAQDPDEAKSIHVTSINTGAYRTAGQLYNYLDRLHGRCEQLVHDHIEGEGELDAEDIRFFQ